MPADGESCKFFWSNVDRLSYSFAEIPSHILKCKQCPDNTKEALLVLKVRHQSPEYSLASARFDMQSTSKATKFEAEKENSEMDEIARLNIKRISQVEII